MNSISIVSVGTNYKYHIYRNFLCSLYGTGFNGECHVLVNEQDLPQTAGLKANFIPIEKYIPDNLDIHIQNYRFKIYEKLLQDITISSEYILFTDFRDIIFQKNINKYPLTDHELFVFQEDQTFDNCGFNGGNYERIKQDLFPDIDYIKNPIICCGTIIVKTAKALTFLEQYYRYIRQALDYLDKRTKKILYTDQTMLNYMYYTNNTGLRTKKLDNLDNLVNTMGYAIQPNINTAYVKDSYIVNKNNEISYIAHQFDRLDRQSLIELFSKFPFIQAGMNVI